MATYNRTSSGGGTVGHPSAALQPYVMTSPVWDTADGGAGGDVIELIDVPADTMILGGCLEVLEAIGNSPFLSTAVSGAVANVATGRVQGACGIFTSADTIDALLTDGGSTGESAARFRIHVVMCDISKNPVESATVSTGT